MIGRHLADPAVWHDRHGFGLAWGVGATPRARRDAGAPGRAGGVGLTHGPGRGNLRGWGCVGVGLGGGFPRAGLGLAALEVFPQRGGEAGGAGVVPRLAAWVADGSWRVEGGRGEVSVRVAPRMGKVARRGCAARAIRLERAPPAGTALL